MRIKYNKFCDWPANTRRQLKSLTLRGPSGMRDVINDDDTVRTWVAFERNIVIGWALYNEEVSKQSHHHLGFDEYENILMVYVRRSHRRRGVGKMLYKRIHRYFLRYRDNFRWGANAPGAFPHTLESYRFFKAMKLRDLDEYAAQCFSDEFDTSDGELNFVEEYLEVIA